MTEASYWLDMGQAFLAGVFVTLVVITGIYGGGPPKGRG